MAGSLFNYSQILFFPLLTYYKRAPKEFLRTNSLMMLAPPKPGLQDYFGRLLMEFDHHFPRIITFAPCYSTHIEEVCSGDHYLFEALNYAFILCATERGLECL